MWHEGKSGRKLEVFESRKFGLAPIRPTFPSPRGRGITGRVVALGILANRRRVSIEMGVGGGVAVGEAP